MALMASRAGFRPALRGVKVRFASQTHSTDNLQLFREINKLASEGKWDNINNQPKLFLTGAAKADAYRTFNKLNTSTSIFEQSGWGPILKVIFRVVAFVSVVKIGVLAYEAVVPEEKRLHYKYRHHGDHH